MLLDPTKLGNQLDHSVLRDRPEGQALHVIEIA